ncbi:MFS transporter [Gemmatimonadota bacterium]
MSELSIERPRLMDPASTFFRWSIMIAAGLMLFGSYFAYDSVAAISNLLITQAGYTATQVGMMDSLYSWPNMLGTVLIAGFLIDRFGTRTMSFILSGLVVLGAVIVAIAPSFTVLLIGRACLGAGAEAMIVCQSVILAKWFKGKELALSFGLALTFMRLGSFASLNMETWVANRYGGISAAFWFAAIMCIFSLIFVIYYVVMEKAAEGKVKLAVAPAGDKITLGDIKAFDSRFWYITILCVAFYGAIFPFRSLAQDFFVDKWAIQAGTASSIISILIFFSMVLAPIIGRVVDKIGKRGTLLMWGTFLMIPAHLSMGISNLHPVYPMIILGFSFSLVSAVLWPAVPLIVKEKAVGTAFGLIFMIQNIGLAAFPVLNGALRDATESYAASQLMFASLGLVGMVFAVLLLRADRGKGGILELEVMEKEGEAGGTPPDPGPGDAGSGDPVAEEPPPLVS